MKEEEKDGFGKPVKKQRGEDRENQKPIDKFIEKQSTIDRIFEELDSLTDQQASKKRKNSTLINTISGQQIDIEVLAKEWQQHGSQYHLEFYEPAFRLLNITGDPTVFADRFDKKLADFKNAVIWGRFEKDSFQKLRRKNKYSGYFIRKHWHYQGLNSAGIEKLQTYIQQAIEVMNISTTHYQFREKMYEIHGLGYQVQTF